LFVWLFTKYFSTIKVIDHKRPDLIGALDCQAVSRWIAVIRNNDF
jgi:hypothetical protein